MYKQLRDSKIKQNGKAAFIFVGIPMLKYLLQYPCPGHRYLLEFLDLNKDSF
jgi:hypothetical protein